jgi:hypothetical protein
LEEIEREEKLVALDSYYTRLAKKQRDYNMRRADPYFKVQSYDRNGTTYSKEGRMNPN